MAFPGLPRSTLLAGVAASMLLHAVSATEAFAQAGSAEQEEAARECTGPAWVRHGTACEDVLPPHDDRRRTFKKLPANFVRGVTGVFSLDNLIPFVAGTVATVAAVPFDFDYREPDEDGSSFGDIGHHFGDPAIVAAAAVGLFAVGRIADAQHIRNSSYDILLATTVNFLYTEVIKQTVNRTRPDQSNNKSFPSGQRWSRGRER